MKMLILAAGEGKRLRPHTIDKPKCMVEFFDKPIIDHILDTAVSCGIDDIHMVAGYKKDELKKHCEGRSVTFSANERFASTNMVSTLFSAEGALDDDIVISYSDIVYTPEVLQKIIECSADIGVVVDKEWKRLWDIRMDDPLDDAETMKIDEKGNIVELGKKAENIGDIEGQYIGLIKINKEILPKVINFYHSLDKSAQYDGKDLDNMYMTSFIQLLIDRLLPVQAVCVRGGWVEVDSVQDLERYEQNPDTIKSILAQN